MWRRWATVQAHFARHTQAYDSYRRYLELGGDVARADVEVERQMRALERLLPGGEAAQAQIREEAIRR